MSYTAYKIVNFGPGKAGLSTVGYTLTGGSRITAGVAEFGTGTGVYKALVTYTPPDAILWDTGQGGSTVFGGDELNAVGIINPEALVGTVVSATTTGVVISATVPTSGQTTNAYLSTVAPRYLTFTSGANASLVVTITGSSYAGGNLTLSFAASTGVVAATAGDTVQID